MGDRLGTPGVVDFLSSARTKESGQSSVWIRDPVWLVTFCRVAYFTRPAVQCAQQQESTSCYHLSLAS